MATPFKSPWGRADSRPPPDSKTMHAEVCVIGAGIAGMAVAYEVSQEGREVVVLDDGPIGGGETGNSTSHLTNAMDDRFFLLEDLHGREGARLCGQSHGAAIDRIEQITADEQIDCDFERLDGYLFAATDSEINVLNREFDAARRAGVPVERVPSLTIGEVTLGPALRFPNQGQMQPIRFLEGLARAIERRGGRIFTECHVDRIEEGFPAVVHATNGLRVTADHVVVATNSPVNTLVKFHTKQSAYRTYVIAARVERGRIPQALYWDTRQSDDYSGGYHYARLHTTTRPQEDGDPHDLLIVGGEDHRTGQADDAAYRWQRLFDWAKARFPIGSVEHRWSGQVLEPVDGVAYIGRCRPSEKNIYVATGDSGQGMTHGMIAGMLIRDLIAGRPNRWADLYDPSRVTLRAAGTYLSDNVNTAAQYLDWFKPGDVKAADRIPADSGRILRRGTHLLACYRDPAGDLHACSAVCTHLGGIVAWNDAAKSWDCPCHGSRFDVDGNVLNGPAVQPLAPWKVADLEPAAHART